MNILYAVTPRPDTGLSNGKLGMWLFLASEIMLFGALFSSYILLRVGNPLWVKGSVFLNIPLATLNTVILITSSITMVMAWASLMMKNVGKFKCFLALTILLGVAFLAIKGFEYHHKFENGLFPKTNTSLAIYFTMTGIHVLHLLAGVLVNLYFLFPGIALLKTDPERYLGRIEISGLYWSFVDLVWIFLFPVLYLL
jgi:heme/copper-type cytochrome/quinol oxidase subunit 3